MPSPQDKPNDQQTSEQETRQATQQSAQEAGQLAGSVNTRESRIEDPGTDERFKVANVDNQGEQFKSVRTISDQILQNAVTQSNMLVQDALSFRKQLDNNYAESASNVREEENAYRKSANTQRLAVFNPVDDEIAKGELVKTGQGNSAALKQIDANIAALSGSVAKLVEAVNVLMIRATEESGKKKS